MLGSTCSPALVLMVTCLSTLSKRQLGWCSFCWQIYCALQVFEYYLSCTDIFSSKSLFYGTVHNSNHSYLSLLEGFFFLKEFIILKKLGQGWVLLLPLENFDSFHRWGHLTSLELNVRSVIPEGSLCPPSVPISHLYSLLPLIPVWTQLLRSEGTPHSCCSFISPTLRAPLRFFRGWGRACSSLLS